MSLTGLPAADTNYILTHMIRKFFYFLSIAVVAVMAWTACEQEEQPQPEVPEGYHLEPVWSETESAIIEDWEIVKDPDDIDDYEALSIMLGEVEQ